MNLFVLITTSISNGPAIISENREYISGSTIELIPPIIVRITPASTTLFAQYLFAFSHISLLFIDFTVLNP